jgi:hypothetical protein
MSDVPGGLRPAVPPGGRYVILSAFGAVVLFRLLFITTFPLNDLGGDAGNYAAMLREGTSSLVHAGGYPFLIGPPFRLVVRLADLGPRDAAAFLLILQHAIDLAALAVLYRVAADIFGWLAATIAVVVAGTNLESLGATSSTYPEWLQAALLVISFAAVYYAYVGEAFDRKLGWYALAAFAFSCCILVKFNAAVLVFVFLAAVVFERLSPARKAAIAATCLAVGALTITSFIVLYHRPSTGTSALTHDRSWVLLTKVQMVFENHLDPANGLDTRRWLALSMVLPRSYEFAGPGMFSHVDAVTPAIREPYQRQYGHLLTAEDPVLAEVFARSTLPEGFSVGLSAIPVAYYVGLAESDRLGVRVAAEAVRARPAHYAATVGRETVSAFRLWPGGSPYPASVDSFSVFGATVRTELPFGHVRLDQRRDYWNVPFSYTVPIVWWPGVRIISKLNEASPPMSWFVALAALALIIAVGRVVRHRAVDMGAATTFLLAAVVIVVVLVSVATLQFRWKEARLIVPILSVLSASALATLASAVHSGLPRARPDVKVSQASDR